MSRPLKWTLAAAVVLLLGLCGGLVFPVELVFYALFGWILFLRRVAEEVSVDWSTMVFSIACLGVFAAGLHSFLRWFAAAAGRSTADSFGEVGSPSRRAWKWRWSVSIVALLIMMFAAGTSMVGICHQIAWLATSPTPILVSTGEAAFRVRSFKNLQNIGHGALNYAEEEGALPPGATMSAWGRLDHGWQAFLLPWLAEQAVFDRIDFDEPWNHSRNAPAYQTEIATYRINAPRHAPAVAENEYPLSDYAANARVWGGHRPRRLDSISDGPSRTILAGEVVADRVPWGYPSNWRDPTVGINRPGGFGSPWTGGANVLMADGSVRFLSDQIDPALLQSLATPDGDDAMIEP